MIPQHPAAVVGSRLQQLAVVGGVKTAEPRQSGQTAVGWSDIKIN